MSEQVFHFGSRRELFGILSLPPALNPQQPIILIPNTGLDHRVGPNRMHVELARALAQAGVASLRLDLAGLGDSQSISGGAAPTHDLIAAMDALAARGLSDRFVGIGLCSGAHDVHQAAKQDERLVGAVFLDGYAFKTPRFWVNYGMDRLAHSKRYADTAERATRALTRHDEGDLHNALPQDIDFFTPPSSSEMKNDLQQFISRNMALCYIYTGEVQAEYNYREQLTDAFPFLRSYPRLTLQYLLQADHSFMQRGGREELIQLLVDWALNGPRPQRAARPESRR